MKVETKLVFILISIFGLVLGFGAPSLAEVGVTNQSIIVGCSNSFSGPLAFTGSEIVKYGIEIYFNQVNEQGGVHGRKLTMKSYDDAYDPTKAVTNNKRLVEQDGVFCILSPQGTSPIAASLEYLEQQKVPLIFPFQGLPLRGKLSSPLSRPTRRKRRSC